MESGGGRRVSSLSTEKSKKSPFKSRAKEKRLYCITVNSLISFMLFPRGNCVCLSARQYVRNFYLLFSRSHGTIRNRNRRRFNRHFYPIPRCRATDSGDSFLLFMSTLLCGIMHKTRKNSFRYSFSLKNHGEDTLKSE